jgi:hypothetical protein
LNICFFPVQRTGTFASTLKFEYCIQISTYIYASST